MNIAVLISGRGSNLTAIHRAIGEGIIKNSRISVVLSSRPEAAGLKYALDSGITAKFINPKEFGKDYNAALIEELEAAGADVVCLAGSLRIVSRVMVERYYGRIMNIHPSLLPSFPGLDAQRHALERGVRVSGCTVHFVDDGVDTGPIIAQKAVDVFPADTADTLSERILEQEHIIYPYVLSLFEQGKIHLKGRKVYID
jgi:phosphoribosylglycinamide formyltransferase-1